MALKLRTGPSRYLDLRIHAKEGVAHREEQRVDRLLGGSPGRRGALSSWNVSRVAFARREDCTGCRCERRPRRRAWTSSSSFSLRPLQDGERSSPSRRRPCSLDQRRDLARAVETSPRLRPRGCSATRTRRMTATTWINRPPMRPAQPYCLSHSSMAEGTAEKMRGQPPWAVPLGLHPG